MDLLRQEGLNFLTNRISLDTCKMSLETQSSYARFALLQVLSFH